MSSTNKMSDVIFLDLNPNIPFLNRVDELLGGVGRLIHGNGLEQIANYNDDGSKIFSYSPIMLVEELETFAKTHLDKYEQISAIFKDEIEKGENFLVLPFWDKSEVWAKSEILVNQPFALLQAIYDAKSYLFNKELSAILMSTNTKKFIIRIQQTCSFGDSYIPLHQAPLDLLFLSTTRKRKYIVEGIWNTDVRPSELTLNNKNPFKFDGHEKIERGSVVFSAKNTKDLIEKMEYFLNGYELSGVVGEDTESKME